MDSLPRPVWMAGRDRFRPLLTLAACYVVLGFALRLVLWFAFGHSQQVSAGSLAWILVAGAVSDVVESLYLLAPFALVLWLLPERPYRSKAMRLVLLGGAFAWIFALTFVAAVEYFFFAEFDARLNLVAVDYLMYPTEVVGDIWDEYPVVPVLGVVAVLTTVVVFALRRPRLSGARSSCPAARAGSISSTNSISERSKNWCSSSRSDSSMSCSDSAVVISANVSTPTC